MSDSIRLTGVEAHGTHGVLASEHTTPQRFVVDVTMDLDLGAAGASDDLTDTVSYADVADDVVRVVTGPHVDLIETLAARIADAVLTRPAVEAVGVTVHKPQAPIPVPFSDVAVRIRRVRERSVVIALGANQGDEAGTLAAAVQDLERGGAVRVRSVSDLFETDPVGGPDQPVYLNAVLVGVTRLEPEALLRRLHAVEAAHGRKRTVRWGPRTLDLDLIQYGDPVRQDDVVCERPTLTLPHPRAHERAFVLVPWQQADPTAALRVGGLPRPVQELVDDLGPAGSDASVRRVGSIGVA